MDVPTFDWIRHWQHIDFLHGQPKLTPKFESIWTWAETESVRAKRPNTILLPGVLFRYGAAL